MVKKLKMKKRNILILILAAITILAITLVNLIFNNSAAKKYYSSNILLKGIIKEKAFLEKDNGIYYIDVINSNVNHFDPRENGEDYNLIIKSKKAELLLSWYGDIEIGDTVNIDFKKRSINFTRANNVSLTLPLENVLLSKWYSNKLKGLHKL
jgi:hypothetical protein